MKCSRWGHTTLGNEVADVWRVAGRRLPPPRRRETPYRSYGGHILYAPDGTCPYCDGPGDNEWHTAIDCKITWPGDVR